MPRALMAAQAWPSPSGRVGPGPVATVPCHARAGPNHRAMGHMAMYGKGSFLLIKCILPIHFSLQIWCPIIKGQEECIVVAFE